MAAFIRGILSAIRNTSSLAKSEDLISVVESWEHRLYANSDWLQRCAFVDRQKDSGDVWAYSHDMRYRVGGTYGEDAFVLFKNGFIIGVSLSVGNFFSEDGYYHENSFVVSEGIHLSWEESTGSYWKGEEKIVSWRIGNDDSNEGDVMSQSYKEGHDFKFYKKTVPQNEGADVALTKIHEQGHFFLGKGYVCDDSAFRTKYCYCKQEKRWVRALCVWSDSSLSDEYDANGGTPLKWELETLALLRPVGWQTNQINSVQGFVRHIVVNPVINDSDSELTLKLLSWEDFLKGEFPLKDNDVNKSFNDESTENVAQDIDNALVAISVTGVLYFSGFDDDGEYYLSTKEIDYNGEKIITIPVFCNEDRAIEFGHRYKEFRMERHRVEEFYTGVSTFLIEAELYNVHDIFVDVTPSLDGENNCERFVPILDFLRKIGYDIPE